MEYGTIALSSTLAAGMLMLVLPRKWVLVPLFIVAFSLPLAQQVIILGLNFPMTRLLILFGLARLIVQPPKNWRLDAIGKGMILWILSAVIAYTLLWQSTNAFVNRLGFAYDAFGLFLLVTGFVDGFADIERVIKVFVFIAAALAFAMLVERATGQNAFSVFGGVPRFTVIRDDRFRCQGAFLHPIMAGTFGASLLPLFVSLGWGRKNKLLALIGIGAATIITITSASSGPAMSYLAAIIGFCAWPLRKRMRTVRWGILFTLVGLHLVMKAPVWALIARVGVVSGSTGYHRFYLVDQFINRFGEWWLVGTRSTTLWGESFMGLQDVTNQYVRIGVDGGFVTLVLFLVVVGLCFRGVGRTRKIFGDQPDMQKLCWAIGVSLFVHIVSFMSVSYFDQIIVVWYALLAMISRMTCLSEDLVTSAKEKRVHLHAMRFAALR